MPRVFQLVLRGRGGGGGGGGGNLPGGFFHWVVGIWQGVILTNQNFFKAKNNILQILNIDYNKKN